MCALWVLPRALPWPHVASAVRTRAPAATPHLGNVTPRSLRAALTAACVLARINSELSTLCGLHMSSLDPAIVECGSETG